MYVYIQCGASLRPYTKGDEAHWSLHKKKASTETQQLILTQKTSNFSYLHNTVLFSHGQSSFSFICSP